MAPIRNEVTARYLAPDLGPDEVTPLRVREELIRCFMSARACIPQPPTPRSPSAKEQREEIEGFVRYAFAAVGADFEAPTKGAILAAMEQCREGARQMQVSDTVLEGHWNEMMRLVAQLA